MEDKKIVADGMELIPVWRVLYQDAWMKRSGRGFWILENMAEGWKEMGWVSRHTFKSEQSKKPVPKTANSWEPIPPTAISGTQRISTIW